MVPPWRPAVCGLVGMLVARRQARNPEGWLLLGVAVGVFVVLDSGLCAVLGYRVHHGRLPLGEVVVIGKGSIGEPLIFCFALVILLFPDGRLTRAGPGCCGYTWSCPSGSLLALDRRRTSHLARLELAAWSRINHQDPRRPRRCWPGGLLAYSRMLLGPGSVWLSNPGIGGHQTAPSRELAVAPQTTAQSATKR